MVLAVWKVGLVGLDIDTDLRTALNIIYACFVLQNFCEMNKEQLLDGVVSTAINNNKDMQPATHNYCYSRATGNGIKGKKQKDICELFWMTCLSKVITLKLLWKFEDHHNPVKPDPTKWSNTQIICRLLPTNCLHVFHKFLG